jgi:hypothetical protein
MIGRFMKRVISKLSLLVTAAALVPFVAATQAEATAVTCGATLTTNSVLTHNLTCPGAGVTLAPNVTLNLHGHTLRGSGSAVGVTAAATGTDVIKNGRLTNWGAAIVGQFRDPEDPPGPTTGKVVVSHMQIDHNASGVDASSADIGATPASAFQVTDSKFSNNLTAIGGLTAIVSVARSSIHDNQRGIDLDSSSLTATRLQLYRNEIAVICVEASCSLTNSVLRNNQTGVQPGFIGSFTLSGSLITGSDVAYNGSGFFLTHTVTRNVFLRNTTAVSISQGGQGTVGRNVFVANGAALTVADASADTPLTLTRNVLVHNGDAITIDDATGISVGHNLATHNSGWGIRVPNATDLGGNHAHHNGNSPQCVGVVC